jgi:hypothetical protein
VSLKVIANDLDEFLAEAAPELEPAAVRSRQVQEVAVAAIDYVLTRVSADEGPTVLGEAVTVAAGAAAQDAGLDPDAAVAQAAAFLREAAEAAEALCS